MKYALKVTRNTRGGQTTVHPVMEVPDGTEGYRLKRKHYQAEGLWLFDTLEDAEQAAAAEALAAEFEQKSDEELRTRMADAIGALKAEKVSIALISHWGMLNRHRMDNYTYRRIAPNPRVVAKLHIMSNLFGRAIRIAREILPDDAPGGNPRMGRGGRPDIWKEAPNARGGEQ